MTLPPSENKPSTNQSSSSSAYTHFLAFPLHCNHEKNLAPAHEQLRENLQILGEKLNESITDNKQKWRMKSFNGLHITLYLLTLKDEHDRLKAVEVLKELDFYGPRREDVDNIFEKQKEKERDDTVLAEEGGAGGGRRAVAAEDATKKKTTTTTNHSTFQQPPLTISLSTLKTFLPPTSPKSKITLHTIPTIDEKTNSKNSSSTVDPDALTNLHSIIHTTFTKHFPNRETRPWIPHVTVATQVPITKRDKSLRSKQSKSGGGGIGGNGSSTTDAQGNYIDERMLAIETYNQQAQEDADADRSSGYLVRGLEIDRLGLFRMGAQQEKEVLDENGCVILQGGDYQCIAERWL